MEVNEADDHEDKHDVICHEEPLLIKVRTLLRIGAIVDSWVHDCIM